MKPRALCIADNNTCQNLAENKGRTRSGAVKYGRYCDTHRRKGHSGIVDKRLERRYLPIDSCEMCLHQQAIDRHRIIPGSEYKAETVVGLCKECHQNIHRFYNAIKAKGFKIT